MIIFPSTVVITMTQSQVNKMSNSQNNIIFTFRKDGSGETATSTFFISSTVFSSIYIVIIILRDKL